VARALEQLDEVTADATRCASDRNLLLRVHSRLLSLSFRAVWDDERDGPEARRLQEQRSPRVSAPLWSFAARYLLDPDPLYASLVFSRAVLVAARLSAQSLAPR
jgi:hypothetical protein